MTYSQAKARYGTDSAETVSPQRLLVMLYDKLVADLSGAEGAMRRGDIEATGTHVGRATEILLELHSTLDVEIWPEGKSLAALYLWAIQELMQARLKKSPERIADCYEIFAPLRDAWRTAAIEVGAIEGGTIEGADAAPTETTNDT